MRLSPFVRTFFFLTLAAACVMTRLPARAQDDKERLRQEAVALFKAFSPDDYKSLFPPKHCQFDTTWDTAAVPEYLARKYFDLEVHSDLVVQDPILISGPRPQDVIDPDKKMEGAFCDEETYKKYKEERLRALEDVQRADFEHTAVSFPIFDDDFSLGIVVVSHFNWWRPPPVRPGWSPGLMRNAYIFKKVDGAWRNIGAENLDAT